MTFSTPSTKLNVDAKLVLSFNFSSDPDRVFDKTFYIMNLGSLPHCILGHDFLTKHSITLHLKRECPQGGILSFPKIDDIPKNCTCSPKVCVPLSQDSTTQASGFNTATFISTTKEETALNKPDLSKKAKELICDWKPLRSSPGSGFQFRVRKLLPGEVKDTDQQEVTCEIKWPEPSASSSSSSSSTPFPSDYSGALLYQLNKQERGLFWSEISSYLSKGWWQEVSRDQIPQGSPVAVCFPIKQPGHSTPVRPVIDLKAFNGAIGIPSSYSGLSTGEILSRIRSHFHKGDELVVLDLSKCYYRFRTVKPLFVRVAGRFFRAQRMLFGLVCGPACLEEATHHFDSVIARSFLKADLSYHAWYYDDLSLIGRGLSPYVDELACYANVLGWDFPPNKRSCLRHALNTAVTPWISHLGYQLRLNEEGELEIRCQCKPLPDVDPHRLTKRIIYSIAGHFTDLIKLHPECRSICDALRSVAGPLPDWDTAIPKGERLDSLQALLSSLQYYLPNGSCIHQGSLRASNLLLCTDAAASAMGYSIVVGNDTLEETSRRWSQRELPWHINRKEARSLAEGLSSVVTWHEERGLSFKTVDMYIDSSTVYRWCTGSPLALKTKTVERQAITRLLNSVREHIEYLSGCGIQATFHLVPSEENGRADYLSRQSWMIPIDYGQVDSDCLKPQILGALTVPSTSSSSSSHWLLSKPELLRAQRQDQELSSLCGLLASGAPVQPTVPKNYRRYYQQLSLCEDIVHRTYVPSHVGHEVSVPIPAKSLRNFILKKLHTDTIHAGSDKMMRLLACHYFWPKMDVDVANLVKSCSVCILSKPSNQPSISPSGSLSATLSRPLQRLYFDVTHPHKQLPPVLTIIDGFSRYLFAFELSGGESMDEVLKVFSFFFKLYPYPSEVYADNSPVFSSPRFGNYFSKRKIILRHSIPNRAQSNGIVERVHRQLRQSILCLQLEGSVPSPSHEQALRWLSRATYVYNSVPHSAFALSPAEVFYGNSLLWDKILLSSSSTSSSVVQSHYSPGDIVVYRSKYTAFPTTIPVYGSVFYVVLKVLSPSRIEVLSLDENKKKVVHSSQLRLVPPGNEYDGDFPDTTGRESHRQQAAIEIPCGQYESSDTEQVEAVQTPTLSLTRRSRSKRSSIPLRRSTRIRRPPVRFTPY